MRIIDIETKRVFNYSFSPAFFANIEFEAFKIALAQYWHFSLLIAVILFGIAYAIFRLKFNLLQSKKSRIIKSILFGLIAIRSITILFEQSWHSSRDFASKLLVEQAYAYYLQVDYLKSITWTDEEIKVVKEIGFDLELVTHIDQSAKLKKYNLILIYLEGFQTDFTGIGGSKHKGITPNFDRFARRHLFVPNFYNAVFPTVNAFVSSQCSLLPQFDNRTYNKIVYAPQIRCLSDFLDMLGYQQIVYQGSASGFSGIKDFSKFHKFKEVLGKEEIWSLFSDYPFEKTAWGINDYDLFQTAISEVETLRNSPPFHISLFTMDTHPPYDTSSKCPEYSIKDKKLNAIHCTDYSFGRFYDYLEKNGLLDDSIILLTGDHMMHGGSVQYGKTFTALYYPDMKKQRAKQVLTSSYTPDIAPTILDIMGANISSFNAGKSLLSSRKDFQQIVAPQFIIHKGEFKRTGSCSIDDLKKTVLTDSTRKLSACESKKVMALFDQWILMNKI